ncbi:hypothetical protein [Aliamphritea ceti]|uniref:hypothetical protein n=1 Tax=Aliamphritea ceti TaxID=1524258 RepID=UPI0021C32009|nr:hypothetical protein [Aliamphritea ceti]
MMNKYIVACCVAITTLLTSPASYAERPAWTGFYSNESYSNKAYKHRAYRHQAFKHRTYKYPSYKLQTYSAKRFDNHFSRKQYGYYGTYKSLPRGLKKKLKRGGKLPPGWQRKLRRGDVLHYSYRNLREPIPYRLRQRLPDYDRARYELIKIRNQIVRVSKGDGTILDIIILSDLLTR